MKRLISKYLFPILLAAVCIAVSCVREDLPEGQQPGAGLPGEESYDGDVLRIAVTLDNLGGVSTKASEDINAGYLRRIENYVDPEKFRVLVFNSEDEFLFESKSRWIKQLDPAIDHSIWSVAIPLYTYGNDNAEDYQWDWEEIRSQITNGKFKIAVLANRPEVDWLPELTDNSEATQFDNSGPNWTRKNSAAAPVGLAGRDVKTVFDLHHSQYDPIYESKGKDANSKGVAYGWGENIYKFIMGEEKGKPTLSATSSWVEMGTKDESGRYFTNGVNDDDIDSFDKANQYKNLSQDRYWRGPGWGQNRDARGWNFRKTRLPDESYPIPMYGIQEFAPLIGWKKGTTIDLVREGDKPISLLRSVVKIELVIPSDYEPSDVVLFYSNIYARCEPMDVWTPTDQIWAGIDDEHKDVCEIDLINGFGRMVTSEDFNKTTGDKIASFHLYRQKLAWLYGSWWQDEKWVFGDHTSKPNGAVTIDAYLERTYTKETERFPRVFNPCIQRNNTVYVDRTYTDAEGNYHYVVYTGERNINDPSDLADMGKDGSGNPTALYWCVIYDTEGNKSFLGDGEGSITYSFPIADYDGKYNTTPASVYNVMREGRIVQNDPTDSGTLNYFFKPSNSERCEGGTSPGGTKGANGTGMGEYMRRVQGHVTTACRADDRAPGAYLPSDYPLPLVRNHWYTLNLSPGTKSGDGTLPFSVQLEERHTRDISFK